MPETFLIEAYSGALTPYTLWCEDWVCPVCDHRLTPENAIGTDGHKFGTHCPLHNPMHCSGSLSGQHHSMVGMRPDGEVFLLDLNGPRYKDHQLTAQAKTVIGRVAHTRTLRFVEP